jgi:hypothetical protein
MEEDEDGCTSQNTTVEPVAAPGKVVNKPWRNGERLQDPTWLSTHSMFPTRLSTLSARDK